MEDDTDLSWVLYTEERLQKVIALMSVATASG